MGDLWRGDTQTWTNPVAPEIPEPTIIPTMSDDQVEEARRRSLLKQQTRGGRASTILSTSNKLG